MKEQEEVLVVGSGAREHAIGWKISQSPNVEKVFFAPGNGGTESVVNSENIPINADDIDGLTNFASTNKIGLTVVGPEDSLAAGIANRFGTEGLRIFGPRERAARLEWDKGFSAQFMRDHHIPQPDFALANTFEEALDFINHPRWKQFVVKATGLAAGKGVIVPESRDEAREAVRRILINHEFGSDQRLMFQERVYGREVSLISLTDGFTIRPFLPARDYKRVGNYDSGPNTGGMGAVVDRELLSPVQMGEAKEKILEPFINALRKERVLYRGAFYVGLMLTDEGLKVLEINARFGDPETEPQMVMLKSDLYNLLKACADGNLSEHEIEFDNGVAISVVLAAQGYPNNPRTGDIIEGLDRVDKDVVVFHAGTVRDGENIKTNGGRILAVTAKGSDVEDARRKIYGAIGSTIHFRGMQVRNDIGR